MSERRKQLVAWLEGFKAQLGQYQHAAATIEECEAVLALYDSVVGAAKIPLEIQNARNARRADGSNLEYGLEYHLERFKSALQQGVPTDKRFPDKANKYITDMGGRQEALLTWLEGFKAKYQGLKSSQSTNTMPLNHTTYQTPVKTT